MEFGPVIKNPVLDINKLVRQGTMLNHSVQNFEGDSTADQATVDLLARKDPVIQEISVGMSGEELTQYTVSGTPPLSLPNSLGKPLKAWSVDVSPYQEGTGDPSPDNVRPIHGTDKLTVWTSGKNLYQNTATTTTVNDVTFTVNSDGTFTADGTATGGSAILQCGTVTLPAGRYRANGMTANGSNSTFRLLVTNSTYSQALAYVYNTTSTLFTLQAETTIGYQCVISQGVTVSNLLFEPMIRLDGIADDSFVPFVSALSQTVLTLPQTVYTGTIGSEGGESRWGEVDLGTLDWDTAAGGFYSNIISDALAGSPSTGYDHIMCEVYKPVSIPSVASMSNGQCSIDSGRHIQIKDNRFTTGEEVKTGLAGVKLIYQLATPTTFAVSSSTIPTPTGTATTWATAEDGIVGNMEVTYIKSE